MAVSLSPELQNLKSSLEEQGVKYALASYVDIHGMCKAKAVPMAHFGQMMQGSELFTGAALEGVPHRANAFKFSEDVLTQKMIYVNTPDKLFGTIKQ